MELTRRNVGYRELASGLAAIGVKESEANLSNKLSRGKFSFAFFLQCMTALGVKAIDITAVEPAFDGVVTQEE